MRIRPRLKTMVPMLLTLAMSAECGAQMMGSPSPGAPAYMGGAPPAYSAMPGGFNPYPQISPFGQGQQTYSQDGLWFQRALGPATAMNRYYLNVSYLRTKTRGLTGRIGDLSAPSFTQEETIDGTTNTNLPDALSLNNFNPANANWLPDNVGAGILLRGGVETPYGWGIAVDAGWNGRTTTNYNAREIQQGLRLSSVNAMVLEGANGEGIVDNTFSQLFLERQLAEEQILTGPILTNLAATFGLFGGADDVLDRTLFNLNALPLQNGVDFDGFNQRFDLDFIMNHSVESYTGAMNFVAPVVYESENITIQPVIGGRFMQVNEGFFFTGVDSGLVYTQNIPDGIDDDNDFVVDNVAETGTATFTQGNPSTDSIIRAFVDSSVDSTMAGPEIGVQYLIGAVEGIRLSGSTKVGALFNRERARLAGDNIGDTVTTTVDPLTGLTILQDLFDTGSGLNAFSDVKETTHVSPMFQQSLTAEVPIFKRVPVLQDMWQLENATFTAGWTYLWVGEVADPTQSINWLTNPRAGVFPTINIKRSQFFQNSFNVGINWEY